MEVWIGFVWKIMGSLDDRRDYIQNITDPPVFEHQIFLEVFPFFVPFNQSNDDKKNHQNVEVFHGRSSGARVSSPRSTEYSWFAPLTHGFLPRK